MKAYFVKMKALVKPISIKADKIEVHGEAQAVVFMTGPERIAIFPMAAIDGVWLGIAEEKTPSSQ